MKYILLGILSFIPILLIAWFAANSHTGREELYPVYYPTALQ